MRKNKKTNVLAAAILLSLSTAAISADNCDPTIKQNLKAIAGKKAAADAKTVQDNMKQTSDGAPDAPPPAGSGQNGSSGGFSIGNCIAVNSSSSMSLSIPSLSDLMSQMMNAACKAASNEVNGKLSQISGSINQQFSVDVPGMGNVGLGGISMGGGISTTGGTFPVSGSTTYTYKPTLSKAMNMMKCMAGTDPAVCDKSVGGSK